MIAGDDFTFSLTMEASFASLQSGYTAVILLDRNQNEVTRYELPFHPGKTGSATVTTGTDGGFAVALPAGTKPPSIAQAQYFEAATYRPSTVNDVGPKMFNHSTSWNGAARSIGPPRPGVIAMPHNTVSASRSI